MNLRTFNQAGIGHIVAVIVLVMVGVVGFAGYTVVSKNADKPVTSAKQTTGDTDKINSKADLEKTEQALTASEAELDGSLDDSSLDADIESML